MKEDPTNNVKTKTIESAFSYIQSCCSSSEETVEKTPINQAFALGQTMSSLKLALSTMITQEKELEEMTAKLGKSTKDNYFLKQLQQYDKASVSNKSRKRCVLNYRWINKIPNSGGGDCKRKPEDILSIIDTATLIKKIEEKTKENNACRYEIQKVTSSLNNLKESKENVSNTPLIQAFALGQTMTCVQLTLKNLQEICDAQNYLIKTMAGELKNRKNGLFDEYNLNSKPILSHNNIEDTICEIKTTIDLTDFEITDVKKIADDSIIIKWQPPKFGPITGYDILINGESKSKVLNAFRTSAVIQPIDLSNEIQISIYAMKTFGRFEPPAEAIKSF